MKINKSDYEYWGQWKQPVLSAWFWIDWDQVSAIKNLNKYGISLKPLIYLDGHFWFDKDHYKEFRSFSEKLFEDGDFENYTNTFNTTLEKCKSEYLQVLNESSENTHSYLSRLFEASRTMSAVWLWSMFMAEELSRIVLKNGIVSSEAELLAKTHGLKRQNWLEKQNSEVKEFAEIAKSKNIVTLSEEVLRSNLDFKKVIDEHVKEFSWFGTHHWMGEPYSLEKCIQNINELIVAVATSDTEEALSEKDIHPSLKLVSAGAFWRTHSAEVTAKVVFDSRPILASMGEKVGLDYDGLIYLTGPEVLDISKNEVNSKFVDLVNERKNVGYGCMMVNEKIELISGSELKELLLLMLDTSAVNFSELKGNVASKGEKVIGNACVILSPSDFGKLQDGDVLIAPETTPDYAPLMKKASAIVTDVGGITSHAAIVSRELKKPCIIGTKTATRTFKDGDRIEVDTETGIVKLL